MSTAPVTPVTPATPAAPVAAPVTAENVNVNMTREQIAAAQPAPIAPVIEAPAAPIPAAVTAPTPDNPVVTVDLGGGQYEVKYLTGETFKGTATEVLAKVGQSHVSTKQWAQSEVAKAKVPATPVLPEPSKFSTPEEEATAAYVMELFAKKAGYNSSEQMLQEQARIRNNAEQFAGQNISVQFAAVAPEFNGTAENSDKLLNTVKTLGLDSLLSSNDPGQQLNALRAAHAFALQNKIYDPRPAAPVAVAPVVATPPPPPIPNSGPVDLSTVPEDLRVNINMSKEEIQRRIDLARQRDYIY